MVHLVIKVFHVSSDDPAEILGLSIRGALWRVAAPALMGVDTWTLLCITSNAAAMAASTSSVVYVHSAIGHRMTGILLIVYRIKME